MHLNSLLLFRRFVAPRISPGARVLELGADGDPSIFCREMPDRVWDTADLVDEAGEWSGDGSRARILMPSPYEIPVPDGTYDVVFSAQVAEHVREIWTWMDELARVTRPGGKVITISPVSWEYHEAPVDCWRMYPEAMRALSERAGLEVELSWCGSLEPPRTRRPFPGNGAPAGARSPGGLRLAVMRLIGWPLPVAHDLVTVAVKPVAPRPA